jgi:hypothetical protein
MNLHQMPQSSGVFRRQNICGRQNIQRAQRDIAGRANRSCQEIQARNKTAAQWRGAIIGHAMGLPGKFTS